MNSFARTFNERAVNLARGGALHNARLILAEVLTIAPDDVVTRINLGWVHENLKQPGEAEKHYRAAVAIDPQHEGARDALALFEARHDPKQGPCAESPTSPAPAMQDWPIWARIVAKRREAGDVGVGSTVERLLGVGGSTFKMLMVSLGFSCGCDLRRDALDKSYAY